MDLKNKYYFESNFMNLKQFVNIYILYFNFLFLLFKFTYLIFIKFQPFIFQTWKFTHLAIIHNGNIILILAIRSYIPNLLLWRLEFNECAQMRRPFIKLIFKLLENIRILYINLKVSTVKI